MSSQILVSRSIPPTALVPNGEATPEEALGLASAVHTEKKYTHSKFDPFISVTVRHVARFTVSINLLSIVQSLTFEPVSPRVRKETEKSNLLGKGLVKQKPKQRARQDINGLSLQTGHCRGLVPSLDGLLSRKLVHT